jgi:hypothetical protein
LTSAANEANLHISNQQSSGSLSMDEQRERDAQALAYLLLDMYQAKKRKEQNDADTSK